MPADPLSDWLAWWHINACRLCTDEDCSDHNLMVFMTNSFLIAHKVIMAGHYWE